MAVSRAVPFLAAVAIFATAGTAHAQATAPAAAKGKPIDFTVREEPAAAAQAPAKSLKWDTRKGRWGVTLNLEQPSTRDMDWNDVQAGAYFRVTPSLRVGGAVALGEKQDPAYKKTEPRDGAPRVRLETAFKF